MSRWHSFLAGFDTEGGRVFIALLLVAGGSAMYLVDEELAAGSLFTLGARELKDALKKAGPEN